MGRRGRGRARQQLAELGSHGTADHRSPLAEARRMDGPLAELLALHSADTAEALQRVLVIPGRRKDTLPDDGAHAIAHAHGADADAEGLVESIVLAITNHRWERIAPPLLQRLVDDEVLDPGRADLLGFVLLESDVVTVTVPGSWLVDFYVQLREGAPGRLDPAKCYSLERRVTPQSHRWAASRSAGSREGIARVLRRALKMDSRHGAAAIRGLIDGTDDLPDAEALELLELAADWPAPDVRLAALKKLTARGLRSEALARAATDRAEQVRCWAERNRQIPLGAPAAAESEGPNRVLAAHAPATVVQASLFD
jgi:hypothetical protein